MFDLELEIGSWSNHLRARGNFTEDDIRELENHMRDEIEDLMQAGLESDEAFLISVKRLGNVDAISQEYSKVNTENLWKHFMLEPIDPETKSQNYRNIILVLVFSLMAGTLIKIPELFGFKLFEDDSDMLFYFRNLGLFILPFIAAFFLIKRNADRKRVLIIAAVFVLSALAINLYPMFEPNHTGILTGLHLPIFLWLIVGVAYLGEEWLSIRRRMDFIRFTGEAFIYGVLIFCGLVVFCGFIAVIFMAIQMDLSMVIRDYIMVYGAAAVAMIAVYLAEAKKSVVENFAPILAKIFSPLFLLAMVAFLAVMIISGQSPFMERDFLIAFDFMLAMVLGLVLYIISARDINQPVNLFDYLNLALIITALIIDAVALSAILFRLSAFGITPNKVAALGENIVLLGNLGALAWLYVGYFKKKCDFIMLEKCQTNYLYIYAAWTAIVALLFPIIFKFY